MAERTSPEFQEIGKKVIDSGKPHVMTVRALLEHFGQYRRGRNVTRFINYKLRYMGLDTDPSFDEVHFDGSIKIIPRPERSRGRPPKKSVKPTSGTKEPSSTPAHTSPGEITTPGSEDGVKETYLTVGLLKSANQKPYSVRASDSLDKATSLMLLHRISHVPVMQTERQADGIITWGSIGKVRAANRPTAKASDCMEPVRVFSQSSPLFDVVRDIIRHGAVLVSARDKTICGLVTAKDIADQFIVLSEPFLYLEQIEGHLRQLLVRAHLKPDELKALVIDTDESRVARTSSVDDLTFGEYVRGLSNEDYWKRLNLEIDRVMFIKRLEEVRVIRNNVMHFHPDGITDGDRDVLAKTREMLQRL